MNRIHALLMVAVLVICTTIVLVLDMRLKAREHACAVEAVYETRYCHPGFELAPSWPHQ